jgi:hypothetical protein
MNCYWPMPFRKHVRITVTNDSTKQVDLFSYQIDYQVSPVSADAAYFHAQWRKATVQRPNSVYTILDGVKGEGKYVGTFLAWTQMSSGWFGEGEVKFYLDGDTKFPTVVGTGTEDYFGGAWGFPALYSTEDVGNVLGQRNGNGGDDGPPQHSLYRWHIMDPVSFQQDLRVTIQDLGWTPEGKYQQLGDNIASTAFWYQKEPHAPFPAFPVLGDRWPQ